MLLLDSTLVHKTKCKRDCRTGYTEHQCMLCMGRRRRRRRTISRRAKICRWNVNWWLEHCYIICFNTPYISIYAFNIVAGHTHNTHQVYYTHICGYTKYLYTHTFIVHEEIWKMRFVYTLYIYIYCLYTHRM